MNATMTDEQSKLKHPRYGTVRTVVVAEWLRRQTRILLGPARVGSNPADNADITFAISYGYSEMCDFNYFIYALSTVVVAEWLRRQTRNLLGPARVGSNPADNADITFAISYGYSEMCDFNNFIYALSTVVVAEWLRRQTRNLLDPARVGSNPADNADITFAISYGYSEMCHFNNFIYALSKVVVAEWLRRQTRNLLGSAHLGSNLTSRRGKRFKTLSTHLLLFLRDCKNKVKMRRKHRVGGGNP
ncbi:unnamed protein product [Clavelina lepadiformis]|uniref:Uncharacterized protein n=1 Tax=Clavelina lepadiformis TaxID=159417 RepID=A0ABP0FGK9_CLALP